MALGMALRLARQLDLQHRRAIPGPPWQNRRQAFTRLGAVDGAEAIGAIEIQATAMDGGQHDLGHPRCKARRPVRGEAAGDTGFDFEERARRRYAQAARGGVRPGAPALPVQRRDDSRVKAGAEGRAQAIRERPAVGVKALPGAGGELRRYQAHQRGAERQPQRHRRPAPQQGRNRRGADAGLSHCRTSAVARPGERPPPR